MVNICSINICINVITKKKVQKLSLELPTGQHSCRLYAMHIKAKIPILFCQITGIHFT